MKYKEFLQEWNNSQQTIEVQTSGSTGMPKKMLVEKQRMINSALITCNFLGLKPNDTALLCMSLKYIGAKMMVVRAIVRHLKLIQVEPTGHPLATISTPITFAAMVPLQVYNSLQVPEEREKLRQIKHLIIGGGAIDDGVAAQLQTFPNAIWSTYGMTETLSHIALRRLSGKQASQWYTPLQGVDITTHNNGCLMITAPHICNQPIETNDIVEINKIKSEEGIYKKVFRVIGRRDNVINTGGVKIQIEELEDRMRNFLSFPYMVTKRKDKKYGEIVVLLIQLSPANNTPISVCQNPLTLLQTIQKINHRMLPTYWEPRLYIAVNQLPLTDNGKPNRAEALKMAQQLNFSASNIYALD